MEFRAVRATAPSAPSADQLRSRLMSPRQKGSQLRPSTHSHPTRSSPIDDKLKFSDTIADSFTSVDWNVSNFDVIKSDATSIFGESLQSVVPETRSQNPLVAKRLLFGATGTAVSTNPQMFHQRPKTAEVTASQRLAANPTVVRPTQTPARFNSADEAFR